MGDGIPARERRRGGAATTALFLTVLTVLTGLVPGTPPAHARQPLDPAELGLEVAVGYDGQVARGRWMPVTVTLAPSRLFAGELRVATQTQTGPMVESREVEVAAGSTKVFRFVVPPSARVTVQLAGAGGGDGIEVPARMSFADTFLVGALGDERPPTPPTVSSYPLGQRGTIVAVPEEFLARSSRSLDSLSSLVATGRQLTELGETARSQLATAVAGGLDLVVTPVGEGEVGLDLPWEAATAAHLGELRGPDGGTSTAWFLEPAPLAWSLTPADIGRGDDRRAIATAVNAGRGRLLMVGAELGHGPLGTDAALWGHLLQENGPITPAGGEQGFERMAQVAGEGLRSDRVSLPGLPFLAGLLALYLLLVGPVNGLVLARMNRRELAWATIPGITLVFTVGAFVAAAGAESSPGLSGRAAFWLDGQGTQVQTVAVRAPRPGEHEVRFPGDDWDLVPASWSSAPSFVSRAGGDTTLRMPLEALQVGTTVAFRDLTGDAPLGVDIDPTPAGARVTVTNRSSSTVEHVKVRAGTISEDLEPLAPGQSGVLEIAGTALPVAGGRPDEFGGLRDADGQVVAPRSLEALLRWTTVDGNPGVVWATGTSTGDLDLGIPQAGGAATDDRGSFIAVGVTAGTTGTETLPWEVDRQLLTVGFGEVWRPLPLVVEGRAEAVLRYRLPNEGTVGELLSTLDRGALAGRMAPGPGPVTEPAPPFECPPEAVSCQVSGDHFEVCFPDGSCEAGSVARPVPAPEQAFEAVVLEVWDAAADRWVPHAQAFASGADTSRLLSPLGSLHVRAVGELQPFDFSGRGLGATRAGQP